MEEWNYSSTHSNLDSVEVWIPEQVRTLWIRECFFPMLRFKPRYLSCVALFLLTVPTELCHDGYFRNFTASIIKLSKWAKRVAGFGHN